MERIREKMLQLFRSYRIDLISIAIDHKNQYLSFETGSGAKYTFVPAKGQCITSTKCSEDVIRIYAGNVQYASDIPKLGNYIEERCIECILKTLEEDTFGIYENFGLE